MDPSNMELQMESLIKLISALAEILWPALGFTILLTFRKEISELLRKIKKGKMFGQEIELTDSLQELRVSAETIKLTAADLSAADPEPTTKVLEKVEHDEIKQVLEEASRSPRVALLTLSGYIEIAARKALASTGTLYSNQSVFLDDVLEKVNAKLGGLPNHVLSSIKLFNDVRNKIVHVRGATEDDIISALDSGISILRSLKALPIQTTTVLHTNIPLYSDAECKVRSAGHGLILEFISPGGIKKTKMILPTFKDWFEVGQTVNSEWNLKNIWGETWYIDPEFQDKRMAWHSSGEFIGKSLDSITDN